VKTFYFDEQAGSWEELERVAIDLQAKVVVSLTDHFTDMINATVTVPDHPQALSYNPTSIKDIKAADPGAGINLIEAPQANNMGDARLFYPIEVPPGRSGMQPQLGLSYNSSGGNGWLGLGWDLAVPAVTIDTRWGVPRYDEAVEDPGIVRGVVSGYQLYLKAINYTQSNGAAGACTITFIRDSELPNYQRRPDVMIDARGGFKVGFNRSTSDSVLALIDLNGDNLPDKVFKQGNGFTYRLNKSGPNGSTVFGEPRQTNLPAISQKSSTTLSFGVEAYVGGVNGLLNDATTFTSGSIYFSDVNADGLPDLVNGGQVLFNHLDAQGDPTFDSNSGATPVPIGTGKVDTTGLLAATTTMSWRSYTSRGWW
jgi:hypothetical protein